MTRALSPGKCEALQLSMYLYDNNLRLCGSAREALVIASRIFHVLYTRTCIHIFFIVDSLYYHVGQLRSSKAGREKFCIQRSARDLARKQRRTVSSLQYTTAGKA